MKKVFLDTNIILDVMTQREPFNGFANAILKMGIEGQISLCATPAQPSRQHITKGKTMKNFAAIDFETANFERTSVCSVGVIVVRDGKKVDQFYSLIHPEPNYYNYVCSSVNGLCREDTEEAPIFPDVWKQIAPKIEGLPLVAHNKAFDETCLKAVFRMYQMDYPDYPFYCTLIKSRQVWPGGHHNLDIIARRCGYDLKNHHHALADAEACAAIALKIL